MSNIRSNLREIFQQKLTEVKEQEEQMQKQRIQQQQLYQQQLQQQKQQAELLLQSQQQSKQNSNNSSPSFSPSSTEQNHHQSRNSIHPISTFSQYKKSPSFPLSSNEHSPSSNSITQKINDISFSNDNQLEKEQLNKSTTDIHNQTFGQLETSVIEEGVGSVVPIGEKTIQEEDDQDNESSSPLLRRVGSITISNNHESSPKNISNLILNKQDSSQNNENSPKKEETSPQNNENSDKNEQITSVNNQNSPSVSQNSPQIKSELTVSQILPQIQIQTPQNQTPMQRHYGSQMVRSTKHNNSMEMSTKIPLRISTTSMQQSQNCQLKRINSIESGRNSLSQSQQISAVHSPHSSQEISLYEILKQAKQSVKKEIRTKMIKMLDNQAKEELQIEQEIDEIEEQINEIILSALKNRASVEVSDFVNQKIITILRADVSKLFETKDLDFWLKFKGIKNKIMGEWIPKIEKHLKENFNFKPKHMDEMLQQAQESCQIEVTKLIKVKMGDIISDFIEEIQKNDKILQGKEDNNKIYQHYKEFVMEVKNGRYEETEFNILSESEYKQILFDLNHLLQNNQNKLKLKYYSAKISIEKSIMKRRNTFFSLNPYLKINNVTFGLILVCTILFLRDSLPLESSIAIIFLTHILYTFIKSQ